MTPERAKNVQYAQPYAHNVMSVYATKDKKIAGFDDLTGMTVGAPKSSPIDTALTAGAGSKANILRFDDDAAPFRRSCRARSRRSAATSSMATGFRPPAARITR
ncbi:Periplasmic component of amino acid ABC-type transporter/signal transduction system [Agrobacterium tumefaciens]|nr:Periplasmic component of amino acid ABC-type transporter/signal transduction system [Agrobacterium tumefaciens]